MTEQAIDKKATIAFSEISIFFLKRSLDKLRHELKSNVFTKAESKRIKAKIAGLENTIKRHEDIIACT